MIAGGLVSIVFGTAKPMLDVVYLVIKMSIGMLGKRQMKSAVYVVEVYEDRQLRLLLVYLRVILLDQLFQPSRVQLQMQNLRIPRFL